MNKLNLIKNYVMSNKLHCAETALVVVNAVVLAADFRQSFKSE